MADKSGARVKLNSNVYDYLYVWVYIEGEKKMLCLEKVGSLE